MCIVIFICQVCGVINFESNFSHLIKPFFYITKKPKQTLKHRKNEKSLQHEIKGLSVVRNCLRPESEPLKAIKTSLIELI